MAHYIDKDALVAEIDRQKIGYNVDGKHSVEYDITRKIIDIINSIKVKEVDLENFIKEEFYKHSSVDGYGQLSVSYNMAEFYSMIKRLTKTQKGELI